MKVHHNTYAIDKHNTCVVAKRTTKENQPFTCVVCKEPVFLRAGEKNRHHFAHYSDSACLGKNGGGGGESEEHAAAKRLIKDNLGKIQVYLTCGYNGCSNATDLWEGCLFEEEHFYVEEEVALGEGYRVDVCVKDSKTGEIKAVIEVMHTHATEQKKVTALYSLFKQKKYVVEVRASEVLLYLEYDSEIWRLENKLTHHQCDGCFLEQKQEELRKLRYQ